MDKLKIVESFTDRITEAHGLVTASNNAAAARLVWLVAIAGFAFLNVPIYFRALLDEPVSGGVLIVITTPWALAALSGVIAHWLLGDLISLDIDYYVTQMADLTSFVVTNQGEVTKVTDEQILALIKGEDEVVQASKEKVDQLEPWVTWIERFTFIIIIFSFIWSVGYALILIMG